MTFTEDIYNIIKEESYDRTQKAICNNRVNSRFRKAVKDFEKDILKESKFTKGKIFKIFTKHFGYYD